ncbi:hypothetical protein KC19_7G012800 [Ceratodon purpureus]|uniref:Uncharacterized protein n=1 Tax=Ceratodon purpureus TaxID=3225 RepID=A0A8T0H5V5_CERPU|nr:hypothetical protein KC19_7G012800 [Ceratodon purpureus]
MKMKEDQGANFVDSQVRSQGFSKLGQVNGGSISGHKNGSELQSEDKMKYLEENPVLDPSSNNSISIMNRQSLPSLKAMADGNSGDAHSASQIRFWDDDDDVQASQLSRPGLDNSTLDQPLERIQSVPFGTPSVVATTINENGEEQAFKKIGDFSLDQLRNDVDKDHRLKKTESLTSTSSPDAAHRLPETNDTNRRERKNAENSNLPNVADKFSERKKKRLLKKMTRVQQDGTLGFDFEEDNEQLAASMFGSETQGRPGDENEEDQTVERVPPLRIVMLIVGTRGDVQPFLAIGKKLQEYGHRVRLATHADFKDFVQSSGIEFYPLGGDPKVLAEYMMKNMSFLSTGPMEVQRQRKQIKLIVNSLVAPCIEPAEGSDTPFNAQAIIANPPVYGHVDVAEYLNVPLHICFTMPWTPTSAFPHPFSHISKSASYKLSYQVVDATVWLGIRSIINDFRKKKCKLSKTSYSNFHASVVNSPTSYLWSPHLVPKPDDWGPLIDVVGFCFLDQASDYKPPEDLVKWLKAGPKPIYVGFGSLPVEDPQEAEPLDFVYLAQDCPHDWLFPQCAAVIHHGGAGTVAAGLKAACPTTVVPFFGDQFFWGSRIHDRGVGPEPIPAARFSVSKLVDAINFMLKSEVKEKAVEISKGMQAEDGAQGACDAFHKHIRKRIPEILHKTLPSSLPRKTNGEKLSSFCTSCWTCHRSHSNK